MIHHDLAGPNLIAFNHRNTTDNPPTGGQDINNASVAILKVQDDSAFLDTVSLSYQDLGHRPLPLRPHGGTRIVEMGDNFIFRKTKGDLRDPSGTFSLLNSIFGTDGRIRLDLKEELSRLDGIASTHSHFNDRPTFRGRQGRLHLHGLYDSHPLSGRHMIPLADIHGQNGPRHGGQNLSLLLASDRIEPSVYSDVKTRGLARIRDYMGPAIIKNAVFPRG